jgi:hypothetical protein
MNFTCITILVFLSNDIDTLNVVHILGMIVVEPTF